VWIFIAIDKCAFIPLKTQWIKIHQNNINWLWTTNQVKKGTIHYKYMFRGKLFKAIFMLPLAYAMFGHKSQGATISSKIIVDIWTSFTSKLTYVMSRVTQRHHLPITWWLTTFALFNIKMTKHSSIIFSHQCDYPNKYMVRVINSKLRNSKVLCRTRINNGATQLVENELRNPPYPLEWTNSSETLHCPSFSTSMSGKILEMKDNLVSKFVYAI
jgi:hypothetical protein